MGEDGVWMDGFASGGRTVEGGLEAPVGILVWQDMARSFARPRRVAITKWSS
jgi:hypothetical protein